MFDVKIPIGSENDFSDFFAFLDCCYRFTLTVCFHNLTIAISLPTVCRLRYVLCFTDIDATLMYFIKVFNLLPNSEVVYEYE